MSTKVNTEHFNELSTKLLSSQERNELQKCLQRFQCDHDIDDLVDTVKSIINTQEKTQLLNYIRIPMTKLEKSRFDQLIAQSSHVSTSTSKSSTKTNNQNNMKSRITAAPNSATTSERLVTISGHRGGSMGFSVRGGSEYGLGIFVSHVTPRSPADDAGLQLGDQVLSANGVDLGCVANSSAVKVLSSSALLNLVIKRLHKVPEWKVAKERVLWFDVSSGRVVSSAPVSEDHTGANEPSVLVERRLVLNIRSDSDYIGLNIRGGKEYGIGIYVSRVDGGGKAANNGLRPGDQIVQVNHTDFGSIVHSEAVDALRSSNSLIITIRSVGKYPVFKELYAEYTWSNTVSDKTTHGQEMKTSLRGIKYLTGTVHGSIKTNTQRERTRETSIDLVPFSAANIKSLQAGGFQPDNGDRDPLKDQETSHQFNNNGALFRRSVGETWGVTHTLSRDSTRSWSPDSLKHCTDNEDGDDLADYTTFLEHSSLPPYDGHRLVTLPNELTTQRSPTTESVTTYRPMTSSTNEAKAQKSLTKESVTPYRPITPPTNNVKAQKSLYRPMTSPTIEVKAQRSLPVESVTQYRPMKSPTNEVQTQRSLTDETVTSYTPMTSPTNEVKAQRWFTEESVTSFIPTNSVPDLAIMSREEENEVDAIYARVHVTNNNGMDHSDQTDAGLYEVSDDFATSSKMINENSALPSSSVASTNGSGFEDEYAMGSSDHSDDDLSRDLEALTTHIEQLESDISNLAENGEESTPKLLRGNDSSYLVDHHHTSLTDPLDAKSSITSDTHHSHTSQIDPLHQSYFMTTNLHSPSSTYSHSVMQDLTSSEPNAGNKIDYYNPDDNRRQPNITNSQASDQSVVRQDNMQSKTRHDYHPTSTHDHSKYRQESQPSQPMIRQKSIEVIIQEHTDLSKTVTDRPIETSKREEIVYVTDRVAETSKREEIVYVSKHKIALGLDLMGGRDDPSDTAIRIQHVTPESAAADDSRLQPGVEIVQVDASRLEGMNRQEAQSCLQIAFAKKTPINMGIRIRHSRL